MKTIFIVNPSARNEQSSSSWDKFSKQHNISHPTYVTTHPREVRDILVKLTSQHPDEWFYIIGVGGDGTMNSVISAAIGFENILIGYIPFGSGNDFARGYNWPNNKKKAYTLIREESSIKNILFLDAGEFTFKKGPNGHFVNNIGIGFDARIAQKANASPPEKKAKQMVIRKINLSNYSLQGNLKI